MDPSLEEKVRQIASRHSSSPPSSFQGSQGSQDPEDPQLPLLPDEEFPSWDDKDLFDYFAGIGVFFMPAKGSNPETMKECFTVLVHRKGVLFHRVLHGDRIVEPLRVVSGSRHLDEGDVGICLTHDEYGRPLKYLEPHSSCEQDWLAAHCQDEDLRTQILQNDE